MKAFKAILTGAALTLVFPATASADPAVIEAFQDLQKADERHVDLIPQSTTHRLLIISRKETNFACAERVLGYIEGLMVCWFVTDISKGTVTQVKQCSTTRDAAEAARVTHSALRYITNVEPRSPQWNCD